MVKLQVYGFLAERGHYEVLVAHNQRVGGKIASCHDILTGLENFSGSKRFSCNNY